MSYRFFWVGTAGGLLAVVLTSCSSPDNPPQTTQPPGADSTSSGSPFEFEPMGNSAGANSAGGRSADLAPKVTPVTSIRFRDVADPSGLVHSYQNGEQGESIMVETLGGGAGWLDYDRDGNWDLYLNQGGVSTSPPDDQQPSDALYRNTGSPELFTDVTLKARIREFGYSQGVAVGDYNGDGFDDVYVTNVGPNTLWRNMGDGTFEEVGIGAHVADPRWSSSAAWYDIDQDGDLDLYVCNYLKYDPHNPLDCRTKTGERRICHPKDLDAWPDECYMNQGDGTFQPEAQMRGLFGDGNKALGVAIADFNNDGLSDVYVANDTTANFLFINQGGAQFRNDAYLLGCAVDRYGSFQASMGLGVGDVDRNGYLDIYSTHYYEESNTLYLNMAEAGFQDATARQGLHSLAIPYLGFGVVMEDFDQNGNHDIFIANGHVENYPGNPRHRMTSQLLSYNGQSWQPCEADAGSFFERKIVGRGVAQGDYDNDGDWDLCVVPQNDPVSLLQNNSNRGNWLKLEFRGLASNRRGVGCRATIQTENGPLVQQICGGTSYASSHQPALIFGLGKQTGPLEVELLWPNGQRQMLTELEINTAYVIDQTAR